MSRAVGVTPRAVLLAIALMVPNCLFVLWGLFSGQSRPATVSLFFNVVVTLLVLVAANRLLGCFRPRAKLAPGELLTIYSMLSLSTAVCGLDQIQTMMPVVAHPFWAATPENRYETLFLKQIPPWVTCTDPVALDRYFDGHQHLWQTPTWRAWLRPAAAWGVFSFAMLWVMLCLNALFRKQWTEEAKLSFPIVQLPLEMAQEHTPLFRSRLMWSGFAAAFGVCLLRGLHVLYPKVPSLGGDWGKNDLGQMVKEAPWTAIGWTPLNVMPFAVGLAFLIPQDLAFSCWAFYLYWKVVRILTVAFGLGNIPRAPWIDEQSFGAYMAICAFSLWSSRRHLREALFAAVGRQRLDDSGEPLPYRWALWGAVGGLAFLTAWCLAARMNLLPALGFLLLYVALSVAVARIRAELGSPVHDLHFTGPEVALTNLFGPARLGRQNLIMYTFFWSFNRAQRSHPMPHQIEGMKLAERTGASQRRLALALTLAAGLGISLGWGLLLELIHYYGGTTQQWKGWEAFNRLATWLQQPFQTNWHAVGAMALGLVLTVFLSAMRSRFVWWVLHPAGLAVSGSWSMALFAPSIFVSWLIKTVILRYAGMTAFRPAAHFFYGLILGEFVGGAGWGILGIALKRGMYNFLP